MKALSTSDGNVDESIEAIDRARKFVIDWAKTQDMQLDAKEFVMIGPVLLFACSSNERP